MGSRFVVTMLLAASLGAAAPVAVAGRAAEVRTQAFELLNQGVAAYRRGDYTEAVERLRRSAAMALNSFRAHYYLGLSLIGDRRYDEAVDALTVALDLDPSHLQAHIAMGDARLKQGDLDEARASYYRALKLQPEYAPALDGLARIEEAQNDPVKAESSFRRAIASNSGYAPAYTHLGDLLLRNERFEEAVALLEEAVSVRPDFAPGLNRLALAYGRLGLYNEAYATIRKALELEPRDPSHPATLGRLQLEQGFLSAAEDWFTKALELDRSFPAARRGLAEVARRRGHYDTAMSHIDQALEDPRLDALDQQSLRDQREAIDAERAEFERLQVLADSGEATPAQYGELALVYAHRDLWDTAVDLQKRTDLGYGDRERLAYMLFEATRYREALELYRELAGEGDSADLEVNMGVAAARLGDDRGAAAAFGRALELQPDHGPARLYLANALLRLGEEEPAVDAYLAYLRAASGGESSERVRRILEQVAPERAPRPPAAPEGAPPPVDDAGGAAGKVPS